MERSNGLSVSATRHRSPAYPGVSLRIAVEKVRVLYPVMKKNAITVESALETLNLKSSTGTRLVAALIMYGFLSDEGSGIGRKVKLTQMGYRFNLLPADDPELNEIIRTAALSPRIFGEMVQKWPDSLPPDSTIRKYLTLDKHFNPEAVSALIKDFKDTYSFANLGEDDTLTASETDTEDVESIVVTAQRQADVSSYEATSRTWRQDEGNDESPRGNPARPTGYSTVPLSRDGMKTLTIELPDFREAVLYLPLDYSPDDLEVLRDHIDLWVKIRNRPPKASREPEIRFGKARWQTAEGDHLVVVTGYMGEHGGRKYVKVEDSDTGIALDEIVYEE